MMLLFVLLLAPQTPPAPPPEEDIVVIGERMRRLRVVTKTDRKTGVARCDFKRRSGDAAFDALMCEALLGCAKTIKTRPQMEACMAPHVERYVRARTAGRP